MSLAADILGWAFILAGSFFTVVGAFGLIRMPDLYTRLHASGVLDPFGVSLILIGLMFQAGFTLVTVKLAFLVLLLLFTSPVACHALARAALHREVKPLLDDERSSSSKR
ncbi:MAG: monovalent cation/H(+) antiporter subunit G [Alphaproteobacteria bacterium]|nr:monovalent cation/H(+) antiporter subunit G [Alphaproteobacteria bacterium]